MRSHRGQRSVASSRPARRAGRGRPGTHRVRAGHAAAARGGHGHDPVRPRAPELRRPHRRVRVGARQAAVSRSIETESSRVPWSSTRSSAPGRTSTRASSAMTVTPWDPVTTCRHGFRAETSPSRASTRSRSTSSGSCSSTARSRANDRARRVADAAALRHPRCADRADVRRRRGAAPGSVTTTQLKSGFARGRARPCW